jgi:nitrogen fixation NifU-like protein
MAGLDDLYKEIILDHYRTPRNKGTLESPPARIADGHNPLCGDEIHVYVLVDEATQTISDIKLTGHGCSISQASASLMTNAVKGKSIADADAITYAFKEMMGIHAATLGASGIDPEAAARGIDTAGLESDVDTVTPAPTEAQAETVKLGDLEALQGVVKFPVRIKCATLGWNTLAQALHPAD